MNRIPDSGGSQQNRWKHIGGIIHRQLEVFRGKGELDSLLARMPHVFPDRQTAIRSAVEIEKKNRFDVDSAIEHFSKTNEWPVIPAEQQFLVFHRLRQAMDLLNLFGTHLDMVVEPPQSVSDSQMLQFLLIYYWGQIGLDRYIAASVPRPF